MPFDPDAYLAQSDAGFDPDAYLADGKPKSSTSAPSVGQSLMTAIGRGLWAIPGLAGLDHAQAQALAQKLMSGGDLAQLTSAQRQVEKEREKAHPVVTGVGIGLGAAPSTFLMPQIKAAQGATLLSRMGASALTAAPQAAAIEGGVTADKPIGERLLRMGTAAAVAGPLAALAPARAVGEVSVPRRARLETTPEAKLLESAGVKNLTAGQRSPQSTIGILERMSADNPLGMAPQRQAAQQEFMRVAQNQGVAPGANVPQTADLQTRLGELFQGFKQAYAPLEAKPVDPKIVTGSLRNTAGLKGLPESTVRSVIREVKDAITVLPESRPATVGDLMKVRELIRKNGRVATMAQDFDKIQAFGHAEDVVTGAIESALDPAERAALQATDRQYARLMTAASAPMKGQTTFTPGQYLRQVADRSGRRNFVQGKAGDLQDLGEAAQKTFAEAPMTGVRPGILSAIPGGKTLSAPLSRLANSRAGMRYLFGTGSPEVITPGAELAPRLGAWERALLEAMGIRGVRVAPAMGEENR